MSELNTLLQTHWSAQQQLQAAKTAEAVARNALVDFLCKDEAALKNKTVNLSGGHKLKLTINRTLRIDKAHEQYKNLPTLVSTEVFNKLCKTKKVTEFSYSAYRDFKPEIQAVLSQFITVNEVASVVYEAPTDNR